MPTTRDAVLLAAMGSPDARQIDGMGGAHPLTSKVAVVSKSQRATMRMSTISSCRSSSDKAEVSDSQPCGNLLAGVGQFAIEKGLVKARVADDGRAHLHGQHQGAWRLRVSRRRAAK